MFKPKYDIDESELFKLHTDIKINCPSHDQTTNNPWSSVND